MENTNTPLNPNQIHLPVVPSTQDHFFTDHFLMFIFVAVGALGSATLAVAVVL